MRRWAALLGALVGAAAPPSAAPAPAEPPSAAPAPAPAEPPPGAAYSRTLSLLPPVLAPGAGGELRLELRPLLPWTLREGVPCRATLATTPGLDAGQPTPAAAVDLMVAAGAARGQWHLVARAAGPQEVSAALDCFLCTETVCQRYRERVRLPLSVAATPTTPTPTLPAATAAPGQGPPDRS